MSGRIRITPEQVKQVSSMFRDASGTSQDMVSRLGATIKGMESEWEGMTKEKFFNDFQQWETAMRQFVELLNGISTQLDQIAERFMAADRPA
jgi:WXG100 family type VII secretion target